MSGPGILWVNSKITKPDLVSPELFTKWYQDVHIPDIFETKGIVSAQRYKSIDSKADRPYLAVYPMNDLAFMQTDTFKAIPVHSDMLPGPSHACFDIADFDTRYYEHVQTYEKEGVSPGPARLVMSAALTPAVGTDEDFDAWYRQEHCFELAKTPGYIRTRRYRLNFARQNRRSEGDRDIAEPPSWLAMHEFDLETPVWEELAKTGGTEWAKKVMGGCLKSEVGVYRLLKAFGELKAKF